MSIEAVCCKDVATARPDDTVLVAAKQMARRNVGTVVVINEQREPVGILTDRDIAIKVVAEGRDPELTLLESVMHQNLVIARTDEGFHQVLDRMRRHAVRRLPVVDRADGRLRGILSLDDLIRHLGREMDDVASVVSTAAAPRSVLIL